MWVQFCSIYIVDCSWSEWTTWGACSASCNGGTRDRVRVKILESVGGDSCEGNDIEFQSCNPDICPPGKVIVYVNTYSTNVQLHLLIWSRDWIKSKFLAWPDHKIILLCRWYTRKFEREKILSRDLFYSIN